MNRQRSEKANCSAHSCGASGSSGEPKNPDTLIRDAPFSVLSAGMLLVLVTLVVYVPAMQCGFIWDDDAYVQNNQPLRSVAGLGSIWCQVDATPQYYPLVHTSYWLEYRLWGLNPAGYHMVNVILHAVSALLVWRILRALHVPAAWVAAAVFALHPVQVESVAWITERKNVLSGLFYFSAALAYLRYVQIPSSESAGRPSVRFYVVSLVLFLCALLSKTVTCSLPVALLLVLWWKRQRIGWPDVRALLPFLVLGIVFGLLTAWLEKHHVGAEGEAWHLSIVERCLVAGRALWFYASKLVWPHRLTFIYPRWDIDAYIWWPYLFPVGAIACIIALWLARARTGRGSLVAVLFFAGTLVPALGFFNVYPMRYSFVADHFQYLASLGLIVLAMAVGARVLDRFGPGIKGLAAVLVLGILGTLTWRQEFVYLNLQTLWRDTLHKNPNAWIAHTNLGHTLKLQGKPHEAIRHYRRALQIKPDAIKAHYNWGLALVDLGELDEAADHFRQTLQIDPNYIAARNNLGLTLLSLDKPDEAIIQFAEALRINSDDARVHCNLGGALVITHRFAEALGHFENAMLLQPDWSVPYNEAAWILATHPNPELRDGSRALNLAKRACQLTQHKDAASLDTMAAAYAEVGWFSEAVATTEAAIAMASAAQEKALADDIARRLHGYQQGRPYRQTSESPD